MNQQMSQILEEVKIIRAANVPPSEIRSKMHELAEAQYVPALDFFLTFLNDPDWDWRLEGLQLAGFHYEFAPNSQITEKIRHLLATDANEYVRLTAAAVLGVCSKWPDAALITALQFDPDEEVRYAAFEALLGLAGLLPLDVRREVEQAKQKQAQSLLERLKEITREVGISWEPDS